MSREILFRGKRVDNGEWVYGRCVQLSKKNKTLWIAEIEELNGFFRSVESYYPVVQETITPSIDLLDKNGKKIFLGDIVRVNNSTKSGVVEFKDFEIRCDIDGVKHRLEYETIYEVIGNIFDKEQNNDI